jgi:hypothetical protein
MSGQIGEEIDSSMSKVSLSAGIEPIVSDSIQDAADRQGVPKEVTRRLLKFLNDAATGDLDYSDQSEVERRIERIFIAFQS